MIDRRSWPASRDPWTAWAAVDQSGRMDDEVQVDASGMLCPLPIIEAAKVLRGMSAGGVLRVLSTDPAFASDFRAFCEAGGHHLLSVESPGRSKWVGRLRKGPAR